jgi:type IV pilus assembly protein PilY1
MLNKLFHKLLIISLASLYSAGTAFAAVSQAPLFLTTSVPPILMLTMGRDHKLYYEAYNDASDLDGDGALDIRYTPSIDYFGYFDSYKCYNYSSNKFTPASTTTDKTCAGNWSGDFLNYLTTSRMDALRKVLYGGYRSTDTTSSTVLERAFIPQDAHSWGKEYTSIAVDGYDIANYAPLAAPTTGNRHLFASTTLSAGGAPVLRVLENQPYRIWEWVSKEQPVAGNSIIHGGNQFNVSPQNFNVRVDVCNTSFLETNCKAYTDGSTTTYKPTGILQEYGDNDSMAFGLLTGSYTNNLQGGVLRKNISSFTDEVSPTTGIFTATSGIVDTIDKLAIATFSYSGHNYNPAGGDGWVFYRPINNGEANDWGNPIAEMMYESLRYFAGKSGPTTEFSSGVDDSDTFDTALGLPLPSWQDPYRATSGGFESCAKPIQLVISDINPSYDTDIVPGTSFGSYTGDLSGLDASALADTIWAGESEASNIFIGQSGLVSDGTPSPKAVTSFSNIRGLSPEEPTKLGGYYAGSMGLYGQQTDISTATDTQNVDTLAVVIASPIPNIEIPTSGGIITHIPFAKSASWSSETVVDSSNFRPTNQIVDFYVEVIANTSATNQDNSINDGRPYGKFIINFEDVEQAADHDMDAIGEYEFKVLDDDSVQVTLDSTYASGSIKQHLGYIVSGSTADGTYLVVRDYDTASAADPDYFLDVPQGELPGGNWNDGNPLPLLSTNVFTLGATASASFIKHDPLWYAAKWSMPDADNSGTLETAEWDTDNDGDPDGYFLVTNAGKLEEQLNKAFDEIVARTTSAAAAATNSTRLDTNSMVYQARFNSANWTGQLLAYHLNSDGSIGSLAWDASNTIPAESARNIFSYNPEEAPGSTGIIFEYDNLNDDQQELLDQDAYGTIDGLGSTRADHIRGDTSTELQNGGSFRNRTSLMGDIVNSDPWFLGNLDNFGYSALDTSEASSYEAFRNTKLSRTPALFFSANDGMLHAINATTGAELFTYIPNEVIGSLSTLSSPDYGCDGCSIAHKYFVDGAPRAGDAYFNNDWHSVLVGTLGAGGKGLFALDVSDPSNFTAADVLWEISNTQAPDPDGNSDAADFADNLGYTLPQASVVRLHNDKWAAVVANGYESNSGSAVLYLIDIETGAIIKSFDTKTVNNGLSTPIAVDEDGDHITDVIYAGDLLGNLWKFNVSGNSNSWEIAFSNGNGANASPAPLFKAVDGSNNPQPITAKPQVGKHPDGGLMVYFGTGKYFETGDQLLDSPPQVHTFYGIRDEGTQVSSRSDLQEQDILAEETFEVTVNNVMKTPAIPLPTDSSLIDVRVTSDTEVVYSTNEGWFMDLESPVNGAEGERVVTAPLLRAGRIIFSTMIPDPDPCGWGGSSWLMEVDALNGSRLDTTPFDINNDGVFDINDLVQMYDVDGDGDIDINDEIPTSGIRKDGLGIIKTPGVVVCEDGTECKYSSGSSGNLDMIKESSGSPTGRQSWRQLR